MRETIGSLDMAAREENLKFIKQEIAILKQRSREKSKLEPATYQDVVAVAADMARGNELMDERSNEQALAQGIQPIKTRYFDAGQSDVLSKFSRKRQEAVENEWRDINESERQLQSLNQKLEELKANPETAEEVATLEQQITDLNSQLEQRKEQVEALAANENRDYQELKRKYEATTNEGREIADDPVKFATETVKDSYKDMLSPEQMADFEEDVRQEYEDRVKESKDRKRLQVEEKKLKLYSTVVDQFAEKSKELQEKSDERLSSIFNERSGLTDDVKRKFEDVDKNIEKTLQKGWFRGPNKAQAQAARDLLNNDYVNLKNDYNNQLKDLVKESTDLLYDANNKDQNDFSEFPGLVTLKNIVEREAEELGKHINHPNLKKEATELQQAGEKLKATANLVHIGIRQHADKLEKSIAPQVAKSLEEVIPQWKREQYNKKIAEVLGG